MAHMMGVVRDINRTVEAAAPWSQAKAGKADRAPQPQT